jgi:hypothetical protein
MHLLQAHAQRISTSGRLIAAGAFIMTVSDLGFLHEAFSGPKSDQTGFLIMRLAQGLALFWNLAATVFRNRPPVVSTITNWALFSRPSNARRSARDNSAQNSDKPDRIFYVLTL